MPPDVDISQCLQVWAGPLSGGETVVGLVNACAPRLDPTAPHSPVLNVLSNTRRIEAETFSVEIQFIVLSAT